VPAGAGALAKVSIVSDGVVLYLSGGIPKDSERVGTFSWLPGELEVLRRALAPLRPRFLDPSARDDDLGDAQATFGRDVLQVQLSDAVLVDARAKRGIGVGAEMLLAKTLRIPVVTLAPPDSHYRRRDLTFLGQQLDSWTHPFVAALSDYIAADIEEAAAWLLVMLRDPKAHVKGPEVIEVAIRHYASTQLGRDETMRSFLEESPELLEIEPAGLLRAVV